MSQAVIGKLMAVLGIDTAAFEKGLNLSQRQLNKTAKEFEKAGKKLQSIGQSMSTYITLPVIGAGAGVLKMAGDFEAAMNRVGIATQASAGDLARMKELALDIGKETTKSASEAADAMDMLAKAGMRTEDILNGGARAAVALSEAAGSELDPAAAAITDTMAQFKKTTADLPVIVNSITGAVNESKFGFDDFTMGMAQAGGVAASAGVEFEDFAAALAATSSQFNSGSDAGTSFKTFILRMTPDTKKAREAMEQYGVSFYDTEGRMKSMADIAQMLQDKFAGMSEMDRTAVFKTLFGTDAIRTAIGLMKAGAEGVEEMNARIQATDASAQAAQRMQGLNAEMEKLGGAIETLAIKIADSGLLSAAAGLISSFAEWVDWMSEAHPTTLKVITVVAALAAAVGPVVFVFGSFFKVVATLLPLLVKIPAALASLKVAAAGLSAIGVAAGGGAAGLGAMALALGAVIAPLALAAAGIYGLIKWGPAIIQFGRDTRVVFDKMVAGIKAAITDRLNAVWSGLKAKIEAVKGWFYSLYDAVVGHSYIPDMVDGIADHMARLDKVLVEPAKKAAEKTKDAFRQLAEEVQPLLDRLFPEAVEYRQDRTDLANIEKALKAGMIDEATAEIAREKIKGTFSDPSQNRPDLGTDEITIIKPELDQLEKALTRVRKRTEEDTARMIESFATLARDAVSSLKGMVSAFKSGDILGGLVQLLDVVSQIAGVFRGNAAGAPAVFGRGEFGSGLFGGNRALGGPVIPGKKYRVGEHGSEWFEPHVAGRVVPANDRGSRVEIIPSPYFDVVVDGRAQRVAAPLAGQAAMAGSVGAQTSLARRQARQIP